MGLHPNIMQLHRGIFRTSIKLNARMLPLHNSQNPGSTTQGTCQKPQNQGPKKALTELFWWALWMKIGTSTFIIGGKLEMPYAQIGLNFWKMKKSLHIDLCMAKRSGCYNHGILSMTQEMTWQSHVCHTAICQCGKIYCLASGCRSPRARTEHPI